MPPSDTPPLLDIAGLGVSYHGVPAVQDASLRLRRGDILAVVGESGSGKSTLARAVMGLVAPTPGSRILLDGQPVPATSRARPPALRRRIGMVFQDNSTAFNPRLRLRASLDEPLILSGHGSRRERETTIAALIEDVGLSPDHLDRFPHELSGGQRQRAGIARALASDPDLLICDEAVSALDVSVQAQILNLLVDIQERRRLALLFITHDFAVVEYLADWIAVMQRGRIVEQGPAERVLDAPQTALTAALRASAMAEASGLPAPSGGLI